MTLSGLDDTAHGVIRSQICAITPLPDLGSVYQTIVQNETIRSTVTQETQVMSCASQLTASAYNKEQTLRPSGTNRMHTANRDLTRKCSVCGRMGHEASSCYKVIGYPEAYGSSGCGRGTSCRGRGAVPKANITQIVGANAASIASPVILTDADRQGLSGISDDQWKIIQRMVGQTPKPESLSGKIDHTDWILDIGATHHMTGKV